MNANEEVIYQVNRPLRLTHGNGIDATRLDRLVHTIDKFVGRLKKYAKETKNILFSKPFDSIIWKKNQKKRISCTHNNKESEQKNLLKNDSSFVLNQKWSRHKNHSCIFVVGNNIFANNIFNGSEYSVFAK